jgi:transposase-like protein
VKRYLPGRLDPAGGIDMGNKSYSPKFKFRVVMEALESDQADAEIARAYDVHPVTLSRWKNTFKDNGPEVFDSDEQVQEYESRIADLEQMLGKKEVEIAMLKNFLGES